MKSIRKTTKIAQVNMSSNAKAAVLKKIKSPYNISFPVAEDIDFSDCEIRITVKDNQIVAKFLLKGVPVTQQVLPGKRMPSPPPMPRDEVIKALEQIRLNFRTK